MPKKISMTQAYDIATAFITDNNTTLEKEFEPSYYTHYTLKRGNLQLEINAPHGGAGYDWLDDYYFKNNGSVDLYRGSYTIMFVSTKHNVGRAVNKSRFNPMAVFTRLREPKFFKILDLAEQRAQGRIKTTDNTALINKFIRQIPEKQK